MRGTDNNLQQRQACRGEGGGGGDGGDIRDVSRVCSRIRYRYIGLVSACGIHTCMNMGRLDKKDIS